jgi:acyl-CoA thioesterase
MSLQNLSPQALAEACAKTMWAGDNATQHLAMTLGRVTPGAASISMKIISFMANGHNTCHGGYIFTLADSAFAFACNTYNQRTVAQHVSITYIAPAFMGDVLTATAREVSRRGRGGIYDVQVANQSGEVIAEFRGHARTIKGTLLPES